MNQDQLYPKQTLLDALKKAKLPHTYKTLLNYEKLDPSIKSVHLIKTGNGMNRFYTMDEIKERVTKIKVLKASLSKEIKK